MVNNELINDYLDRFDEMPPKYISISTDDEDYLRLVATALVEDRKIDSKMFQEVFKNKQYDIDFSFDETDNEDFEIGE